MLRSSVVVKVLFVAAVAVVGFAAMAFQPAPAQAFTYVETFNPPYSPPANPDSCDYLHEIYPIYCRFWHVLKWEKVPGQYHGGAVLDLEPFTEEGDCYRFFDLVMMTVVDSTSNLDTLKAVYEGAFEDVTTLPVLNTQWHEIWPTYSQRWKIIVWIDNGDGYLSACDYLVIALKPDLTTLRLVHVISVRTAAKIAPEEEVPGLSTWGMAILLGVLVVAGVWLMRRRRVATLAA